MKFIAVNEAIEEYQNQNNILVELAEAVISEKIKMI